MDYEAVADDGALEETSNGGDVEVEVVSCLGGEGDEVEFESMDGGGWDGVTGGNAGGGDKGG